jgi:hypothetical protein
MDWLTILILVCVFTISFMLWMRTVPKRRFVTFLFLLLPIVILTMRWAAYRKSWAEWLLSAGAAMVLLLIWWLSIGRKLPTPKDGTVRVWTKDDPFE